MGPVDEFPDEALDDLGRQVQAVFQAKGGEVFVTQLVAAVVARPGQIQEGGHDAIDATKISNELGWRPSVTFEEGLSTTVDWYLSNESWWRRIISGEYTNYYREMYEKR